MTRLLRLGGLAVAPAVALMALAWAGGLTTLETPGLPDAGAFTRVGLPIVQSVRDLSAALTVGSLALAALCVPPGNRVGDELGTGRRPLLDIALLAASTWGVTSLALVALVYSDASGTSMAQPGFLTEAMFFARNYELGTYLAASAVLAAAVAVGALLARRTTAAGLLLVLAVAGLWPMALTGHAATSSGHDDAVNLQAMHLLGLSVWAGGLGALVLTRRRLDSSAMLPTVERYSRLALWSLPLVAFSGLMGGLLRLPEPRAAFSVYGALLGFKVLAVGVLVALGWWQRKVGLLRLAEGREHALLRMAILEVVILAAAAGVGVALSRTPPPGGPELPVTAAQSLLGHELPPALGAREWFTQWQVDTFWLPIALVMIGWYVVAVTRLRARGDAWPVGRTVAWVFGWLFFIWATSGAPGAYGRVLFSMHMVQHMTIALAVPTFLVLGAPVTLALRTLPRREDGSRGPREWLLRVVHSWPAHLLGNPAVAGALVVVSLVAFYYSSLFETSLRTHTGHQLMTAHFLITGFLFASCLVGVDPGPRRPAYPFRVLLVLVVFGCHALFSVSLMASRDVLARDWFELLGRRWGASLEDDQYLGASLGWALGDYPLAVLAAALVVSWVRADRREGTRLDRQADRDGDRQLAAYNDYLSRLAEVGPSAPDRRRVSPTRGGEEGDPSNP